MDELPSCLRFERSQPVGIPAESDYFDVVTTWSVFEHVDDPVGLLGEVSRVLKPDGFLFLQLWPFYDSEHGGHLWPHYEGPYPHHLHKDEEILSDVEGQRATDPRRSADDEYRSLNRLGLDDLHRALLANGLAVGKAEALDRHGARAARAGAPPSQPDRRRWRGAAGGARVRRSARARCGGSQAHGAVGPPPRRPHPRRRRRPRAPATPSRNWPPPTTGTSCSCAG